MKKASFASATLVDERGVALRIPPSVTVELSRIQDRERELVDSTLTLCAALKIATVRPTQDAASEIRKRLGKYVEANKEFNRVVGESLEELSADN